MHPSKHLRTLLLKTDQYRGSTDGDKVVLVLRTGHYSGSSYGDEEVLVRRGDQCSQPAHAAAVYCSRGTT